ncbi:MAG: T9SS type A sorting domain-containing protein [bacterium]
MRELLKVLQIHVFCFFTIIISNNAPVESIPAFVTAFLKPRKLSQFAIGMLMFILCFSGLRPSYALPAFPGAEGYGVETIGGRGGRVIKVTNLMPSGPGSLYDACMAIGPRIVVFEVSGTIRGSININSHYITIAGQTAPGEGITIEGHLGNMRGISDIVVRFLRVRQKAQGPDDVATIYQARNVILDHCSFGWGCDENMDFSYTRDITMQWCIINESAIYKPGTTILCHDKGIPHNYGIIHAYGDASKFSMHHNLLAQHERRYPLTDGHANDIRNNVMYNWSSYCIYFSFGYTPSIPYPHTTNIVNNYFKRGTYRGATPIQFQATNKEDWKLYIAGNYLTGSGVMAATNYIPLPAPLEGTPNITTHTAEEAYNRVIKYVGAWPRDSLDRRNIMETQTGTGTYGRHETPLTKKSGTVPEDTDDDGMPDEWETQNGLDPNKADASGTDLHGTYTNIEVYINQLADKLIGWDVNGTKDFKEKPAFESLSGKTLHIYPNPFVPGSLLEIGISDFQYKGAMGLELVDIKGRILNEWHIKKDDFNSSGNFSVTINQKITSGIYLLKLTDINGNKIFRKMLCCIR